jgi:hypothetical protein
LGGSEIRETAARLAPGFVSLKPATVAVLLEVAHSYSYNFRRSATLDGRPVKDTKKPQPRLLAYIGVITAVVVGLVALEEASTKLIAGAPTLWTAIKSLLWPQPTVLVFTYPNVYTKDGEGNNIGSIGDISVSVTNEIKDNVTHAHFVMHYGFYNGSGTWRGSQNVTINFKGADGAYLQSVTFSLDRGRCIYGRLDPRVYEGDLKDIKALIRGVEITVSPLTGVQTRC